MSNLNFFCEKGDFSELNINWAEVISNGTVNEEFLLSQSEEDLLKMAEKERIIIATFNDVVVGSIVLWDINKDKKGREWNELGTVLVLKEYRRKGIGEQILQFAFNRWNGQNIMSTTKNLLYAHIALKNGMVAVYATQDMADVIPLTCVCGNRIAVESSNFCPFRNDKCIFLVTSKTAQRINCTIRTDLVVQSAIDLSQ